MTRLTIKGHSKRSEVDSSGQQRRWPSTVNDDQPRIAAQRQNTEKVISIQLVEQILLFALETPRSPVHRMYLENLPIFRRLVEASYLQPNYTAELLPRRFA